MFASICVHVLVSAEAFLWLVFSGVGAKAAVWKGRGPLWLEEAAESVESVEGCGVGRTKAARGGENRAGATSREQAGTKEK